MINQETINKIINFRDERDWKQFHTIKDLALGLGVEVSEFQELFLWKTDKQIEEVKENKLDNVKNEVADIFIFLTYICNHMGIDLDKAVRDKIMLNELKYPMSKSKGNNKKYTEL